MSVFGGASTVATEKTMTRIAPTWKLAALVGLTMLSWSAFFRKTYAYSFYWDDLHFIRSYSLAELLSTFHGPNDPDGIEIPALRPIATLLFCFQGIIFGDNLVPQRVFMAVLMGGLLWVVGLLLREVGLSLRHIAVVFVLFASSRVFASLMLWITLGSLILSYIFMTLTALFYLRWVNGGAIQVVILALGFAALTIFTREEAYTLPVALPLLWFIASPDRTNWRRAVTAALAVTTILAVHFILRGIFIPDAPPVLLSLQAVDGLLDSARSAWMPGGYQVLGGDKWLSLLWLLCLGGIVLVFVGISTNRFLMQFFGVCALGIILCIPALGRPREFGIAMPALTFFTAISLAIFEIYHRCASIPYGRSLWRPAVLSMLLLGVAVGVGAGMRRSLHVAEAIHENSVTKVIRDGTFHLDLRPKPASVPAGRREAGLARLADLGIHSRQDLQRLETALRERPHQFIRNRDTKSALFLEKYDYLSF
jgi:hypothetical protein